MNRPPNHNDDWNDIRRAWRDQDTVPVDTERLRNAIASHSRRLRFGRAVDLVAGAVALALCLRALLRTHADPVAQVVYIALIVVVIASVAWTHWLRRGQWRALSDAPTALIEFEIARIRTSLRIWRGSVWSATTVWIGLWLVTYADPRQRGLHVAAVDRQSGLWLSAIVVLVAALMAWWLARRARERRRQLERFGQALRASD